MAKDKWTDGENMLLLGDCLLRLKELEDDSVDTLITDPPYGLSFMGKKWDYDVPTEEVWLECLRVLKPGGTALIFAGSRTYHRMAVRVEDAGFILKDCIMWLYGSGFPKATDISKQLDKNNGRSKEYKKLGKYLAERIIDTDSICAKKIGFSSALVRFWRLGERIPNKITWLKLKERYNLNNDFDWLIEREEVEREIIGKDSRKANSSNFGLGLGEWDLTKPSTPEAKLWNGWKSHGLKPAYEPIIVAMKPNGEPAIDILEAVVYTLGNNGFSNIVWNKKPVSSAEKQRTLNGSIKTRLQKTEETSVVSVKKLETQNQEKNIEPKSSQDNEPTTKQILKKSEVYTENLKENSESKYSRNTEVSANAVEKNTKSSLPLTTLTGMENSTEKKSVLPTSTEIYDKEDSQKTITDSCATTVISLVDVTTTALTIEFEDKKYIIERLSDGSLVWPSELPKYRNAQSFSYAQNALKHGVSGLNIDGGRIKYEDGGNLATNPSLRRSVKGGNGGHIIATEEESREMIPHTQGRFPANVILECICECDCHCFCNWKDGTGFSQRGCDHCVAKTGEKVPFKVHTNPECPCRMLNEQSGELKSGAVKEGTRQGFAGSGIYGDSEGDFSERQSSSGGASRFFKSIPVDSLCTLCYTALREDKPNLCTTIPVDSVKKSSKTTQVTNDNIAPLNVEDSLEGKLDQLVKSVENLCQTCTTSIVQSLVVISEAPKDSQSPEVLKAIQVFTGSSERCSLIQNLALTVERWESIDTTPTTRNFMKLFGCVLPVIEESTKKENLKNDNDQGQAIRFKYVAKASKSERNAGCEELEEKTKSHITSQNFENALTGSGNERNILHRNNHPTVKPLKLMEYLCTLTKTPTGGKVLDPFLGSGTTGVACVNTGREFIGIEREEEYIEIAKKRIEHAEKELENKPATLL